MKTKPTFYRQPPQSIEGERSVLGAMLLNPEAVGSGIEVLHEIAEEAFYDRRHQCIYQSMVDLFGDNKPVDIVTLHEKLNQNKTLEEAGGLSYLADITEAVPTSANIEHYAKIVLEKHTLRQAITTCSRALTEAYEPQEDVQAWVDKLESNVFALAQGRAQTERVSITSSATTQAAALKRILDGDHTDGLMLGFQDLDDIIYGLHPGDMAILAARPSLGKTALALNMAYHVGKAGTGVLFFSLEMTLPALANRLIALAGQLNVQKLERRKLVRVTAQQGLKQATEQLRGLPLHMVDAPRLNTLQLRADVRRHAAQHPLGLIVIDYLQLMTVPGKWDKAREQEVANISRTIKATAKEAGVPVLALAQLNRMGGEARPRLSNLRESGAIEQDADVVILLSEEEGSNKSEKNVRTVLVDVAKHRNGPTGDCRLLFLREYQTFRSLAKAASYEGPNATAYDQDFEVENYTESEDLGTEEEENAGLLF